MFIYFLYTVYFNYTSIVHTKIKKKREVTMLYKVWFRVYLIIEYVTVTDVFNLNSMINHCKRKTILNGDCVSLYLKAYS